VLGLEELALNFAFVDALLKLELFLFPTPFLHLLLANQNNVRQGLIDDVVGQQRIAIVKMIWKREFNVLVRMIKEDGSMLVQEIGLLTDCIDEKRAITTC
jgi:hypothetical protein